jgi:hypothetical protein
MDFVNNLLINLSKAKNEEEIRTILYRHGKKNFREQVEFLAEKYNIRLIEVYTEQEYKEAFSYIIKTKILH